MAITTAELIWRYSINTGPGLSTAQANPNDSIGGFISSTAWAGGTIHDLFDPISGDENAASTVDFRCVFFHNTNASLTLSNVRLYMPAEVAGGANAAVGIATQGVVTATSSTAQATRIANELTAPSPAVAFSSPTTKATGIAVPNIPAGSCVGVWIRRSATNSAAINADGVTVRIEGDTAA